MYDPKTNLQIETPENVVLDADVVGFGTRSFAAIIDYLILLPVLIFFTILYVRTNVASSSGLLALALYVSLITFLLILYHLFFEYLWNGQTPGKRILKVRVVQCDGLPMTTSAGLIRNLIRLFDFFPLFYGVGMIALFTTRHTQRLGDLAAQTVVVREGGVVSLKELRNQPQINYRHISRHSPLPPTVTIQGLTPADYDRILNYLHRRYQLSRDSVGIMLAQHMAARNGQDTRTLTTLTEAERYLEQLARAFELARTTPETE